MTKAKEKWLKCKICSQFIFETKALLAETNHVRFLVVAIPIYVQKTKEIDFSTESCASLVCSCMLG